MTNTKQTYLYARCFFTSGTPDMTPIRFIKANSQTAEVACYPNSLMILVRVPKEEIIHKLKPSSNPCLYTYCHHSGNAGGTYVMAEEEWTRPNDIDADYEPLREDIDKHMKQLAKPKKQGHRSQFTAIAIGKQTRAYRKKVNTYA